MFVCEYRPVVERFKIVREVLDFHEVGIMTVQIKMRANEKNWGRTKEIGPLTRVNLSRSFANRLQKIQLFANHRAKTRVSRVQYLLNQNKKNS